jgi:hypothetical protein
VPVTLPDHAGTKRRMQLRNSADQLFLKWTYEMRNDVKINIGAVELGPVFS